MIYLALIKKSGTFMVLIVWIRGDVPITPMEYFDLKNW